MALSVRQKVFFFVGLNLAIFGLALSVLGAWGTFYWTHGSAGASMWCGVFLIMCGAWDIVIAIDQDPAQETGELSLSGLLVNMIAVLLGIAIIGFSTWASWSFLEQGIIYGETLGTERQIELYVTVILLGAFTFILGLIALMADCCCGAFFGPGIPATGPPAPIGYPGYPPQAQVNYGYPQF